MTDFDPEAFVNDVIDQFEFPVADDARIALVTPAQLHKHRIRDEIVAGEVSRHEIANAVQTVLGNAKEIALQQAKPVITSDVMDMALSLECKYFPWC